MGLGWITKVDIKIFQRRRASLNNTFGLRKACSEFIYDGSVQLSNSR